MISFFGMSEKIGNRSYYDSSGQQDFAFNKPYSEKTAETIDEEVKTLIDVQYERAKTILKKNKKGLKELAEILLEKEVIFSDDLEKIFGKRQWIREEPLPSRSDNAEKTPEKRKKSGEKAEVNEGEKAEVKENAEKLSETTVKDQSGENTKEQIT